MFGCAGCDRYKQLLLTQWLHLFDVVKVSDADLAFLYGESEKSVDLDAIAAEWLAAAAPTGKLLLITRGADGTVAYRPGRGPAPAVRVALQPVQVVDTVGAGDSYMGAFLVSLRSKRSLVPVSTFYRLGRGRMGHSVNEFEAIPLS